MTATTTITKIAQMTILCTGLFVANGVLSKDCEEGAGAANIIKTNASGAGAHSVTIGMETGTLSAAERYELFHDVVLNKPDDLGDYGQDYLTTYPQ